MYLLSNLRALFVLCLFAIGMFIIGLGTSQAKEYRFTDSFGQHFFKQVPQKVVITDWTLADQLIALGVEPMAMPEVSAYQDLIGRPALPDNIVDIGKRRHLDIDKIEELKPDVIILGTQQKFYERRLSPIAYVNFFQNFSMHYRKVGEKARERFMQFATMFKKQDQAKAYLSAFDQELENNKQRISEKFKETPKIVIFRFAIDDDVLVYGENSLSGYVLDKLGLENAYTGRTNQYGDKRMSLGDMLALEADIYCYILPRNGLRRNDLEMSDQALADKMQEQGARLCQLPKVNSYGGVPAMRYMQSDISEAVLKHSKEVILN